MGGKTKARKKQRTSKHILDSQERKKKEMLEAPVVDGEEIPTIKPNESKKKKTKKQIHLKDPKEARTYLSTWKHRDSTQWKFNKNTQSWIFRHAYDPEKIHKASFDILLEYLGGLKGSLIKVLYDDAIRRAMRYKEWEKKASIQESGQEGMDDSNKVEDVKAESQLFNAMSDHDKRKEYKRSRKIIEVLKKSQELK